MKVMFLIASILAITSVQAAKVMIDLLPQPKRIKVRITGYWPGEDAWSTRYQSSTGTRLRAGRHCAVDPDIIPLGRKIRLIGTAWEWRAVDTGSAVKSKKASRGKLPVVDIFAASEAQFKAMRLPKVATVEIINEFRRDLK